MNDPILEGPQGQVIRQIKELQATEAELRTENSSLKEKLEANSKKDAGIRAKYKVLIERLEVSEETESQLKTEQSEMRSKCKALHAEIGIFQEENEKHLRELFSCRKRNYDLGVKLQEANRNIKDAIDAKDDMSSKLEAKEVDFQLMKARVKKAKRKSTESEHSTDAATQTLASEEKGVEAVFPKRKHVKTRTQPSIKQMQMLPRTNWPGFEVLEKKGARFYRDMYDGATFFDDGASLTTLVASLNPSRHVPEEVSNHVWALSRICGSLESPKAEMKSEETPALTAATTPVYCLSTTPATPLAEEETTGQHAKTTSKIPPPPANAHEDKHEARSHSSESGVVKLGQSSGHKLGSGLSRLQTKDKAVEVILRKDSALDHSPSNRTFRHSMASPPPEKKTTVEPPASLIDCSIPAAFRDGRRESRGELRPIRPASSSPTHTEEVCSSQNAQTSRKGLKRLLGPDMTDQEFEQATCSRRHVCVHCWACDLRCDANAQCKACSQDGVQCVRMKCRFGLGCRHSKCVYLHPGQWDEDDEAWIVHNGSMGFKAVNRYGRTEAEARHIKYRSGSGSGRVW